MATPMVTAFRQGFSTPGLVHAARESADRLVDGFLRNPEDQSILSDIVHCGDGEMFARSMSLKMRAMEGVCRMYTENEFRREVAEFKVAATRLQAMLHRGKFLMERLGKESHPHATELVELVGRSRSIAGSAFDEVTARLFSLTNGVILFRAERDAGMETERSGAAMSSMTQLDIWPFGLVVAIGLFIIVRSCS